MYKLVILDIDGTLVDSNKKVSEKTKEYIKKASEMGTRFVIASGRTPYGILPIAKEINLDKIGGYILAYNGGACINCENMETLYEKFIDKSEIEGIYNFAKDRNLSMLTYKKDVLYTVSISNKNIKADETTKTTRDNENKVNEYIKLETKLNHLKINITNDFANDVDFDFPKVIIAEHGDILENFVEEAQNVFPQFEVFRSEPFFLEICPKGVHKAQGIKNIIEILGVKREEVIAIGDGFNDITMIEYAGLGVAMDNAHQPVKDAADYITASNDDDGVCDVIDKFIFQAQK